MPPACVCKCAAHSPGRPDRPLRPAPAAPGSGPEEGALTFSGPVPDPFHTPCMRPGRQPAWGPAGQDRRVTPRVMRQKKEPQLLFALR